jgi:spermidine synthase
LVLEIAYTRLLRYWVGNTSFAAAVVLSAYMLGLAAGSLAIGRVLHRVRRPLALYGAAELAIGLFSLLFPYALKHVETAYLGMTIRLGADTSLALASQFVISLALLLCPTILMGLTFPVAVRAASGGSEDEPGIAKKLYGANLAGAALGALFSNFVLIPFWGLGSSLIFAAATNGLVALAAFILHRSSTPGSPARTGLERRGGGGALGREAWPVLFVALAGGFLVLFQEIVWNHMIGEFLDSSAYGFAIMLFAVIAGLAAGAGLSVRYLTNRPASTVIAWFCLGTGGLSLLLTPFWDRARFLAIEGKGWSEFVGVALMLFVGLALAPQGKGAAIVLGVLLTPLAGILVYRWLQPLGGAFWVYHAADFCVSVLFMLGPAVCMGLIFPLVLKWSLEVAGRDSRAVAYVYGTNTLGSLLGILAATFLVLPKIGVEWGGRSVALVFFALGVWLFARRRRYSWAWSFALVPALVWCARVPAWDFSKVHEALGHSGKMVFAREDLDGGVTSVLQYAGTKQLYLNGLYEAGNDYEVLDQSRLALIPSIYATGKGSALVIGMGSGQTAGIVGLFPFPDITIVDYSRGVAEAARRFFGALNLGILADPRTKVVIADGRHYLLTHPGKVDLMTIEVSRLWVAGEGDLYTREFYELCSSRLTDQGVLQQWVPLFNLTRGDTLMILRTVRAVFPHVVFYMGAESGLVVASRQPLAIDYQRLEKMNSRPEVQDVLRKLGMPSIFSLLGDCVLDEKGLDNLLGREPSGGVSTDLWPYLEYSNARSYLGAKPPEALRQFLFQAQEFRLPPVKGADAASEVAVRNFAAEERQRVKATLSLP